MRRRWVPRAIGGFAVVFGLLTLAVGGPVLLDVGTARADHGHYVPFVLVFTVFSGFLYVAAGLGVALERTWATLVSTGIAAGIAVTGAGLGAHIAGGGLYETETVAAMSLRFLVWVAISAYTWSHRDPFPEPSPG